MNTEERTAWLASLKVGDRVYIRLYGSGMGVDHIDTIERITPTRRMTVGGRIYRYGECRADSWTRCELQPITPELEEKLRIQRLREGLKYRTRWDALSDEKILAVAAVLWPKKGGAE